jgi:hypothetical protein
MIIKGQVIEIDRTSDETKFFILQIRDTKYFLDLFESLVTNEDKIHYVIPLKFNELKIKTKIDIKEYMGCYVRVAISIQKFAFNNIKGYKVLLQKIEKIPAF